MSFDLTLLFLHKAEDLNRDRPITDYSRLWFIQDYKIFSQFGNFPDTQQEQVIQVTPLPPNCMIMVYEDEEFREPTRHDPYDNELAYVSAKQMKALELTDETSPFNIAIKVFIDALPDDTPIILYWH